MLINKIKNYLKYCKIHDYLWFTKTAYNMFWHSSGGNHRFERLPYVWILSNRPQVELKTIKEIVKTNDYSTYYTTTIDDHDYVLINKAKLSFTDRWKYRKLNNCKVKVN